MILRTVKEKNIITCYIPSMDELCHASTKHTGFNFLDLSYLFFVFVCRHIFVNIADIDSFKVHSFLLHEFILLCSSCTVVFYQNELSCS